MAETILVTGGAGFIGSHLCARLLQSGLRVRVLDDLSSGKRDNLPPDAELILGDVADAAAVGAAMTGVAGVYHLAAIASVARGLTDWLGTHRVNLTGAISVFDAARRQPVPVPVVYASSAAVFGACDTLPITEAAEKLPLSSYGADKYGCELHARAASLVHGVPTVGLRFFNVYGPRQDPASPYSGVISIFCDRIARGAGIALHGDGLQTRDFVYVDDVVAALVAALALRPAGPAVFNICTGVPTSVLDLAQSIAALCGRALDLHYEPARAGDIRHSLGSPQAARTALGLGDPVPLAVGLARTLDWLGPHR